MNTRFVRAVLIVLVAVVVSHGGARAEMVEEILAWVNGEIITKSDFDQEEQLMLAEAYRRFTGDALDRQVASLREDLLLQMIDRRILVDRARRLYDVDKMGEVFFKQFRDSQDFETDEEFEQALAQDGMTSESLKQRLIDLYAPDEVIRVEVGSRVSVGDREVEAYYEAHPNEFSVVAEVTFREIVLRADTDERKRDRRAEAEEILSRVQAGEDFAELASQLSEAGTKENGGLLGPMKRADLTESLAKLVYGAPIGAPSAEILEAPYGFHLVLVVSRTEDGRVPLEEVHDQLRGTLENRKYSEQIQAFMDKARAEAEWCVKPRYGHLVPVESSSDCAAL